MRDQSCFNPLCYDSRKSNPDCHSRRIDTGIVSCETRAIIVEDGLCKEFPDAGFAIQSPSRRNTRNPFFHTITKHGRYCFSQIRANEDKAGLSFDDNELSEWTNDGHASTGWITYQLERNALISEICLKLTGWRSRSYPLEIFVNDTSVWEGNTSQSLGYVTIPVKPARGNSSPYASQVSIPKKTALKTWLNYRVQRA